MDKLASSANEPAPEAGTALKERRAYQDIGNDLVQRIRAGEFHSTGKLPPERDLAAWYDVGRTVIRDALVMLDVKGLIDPRQGSGIYITRTAYQSIVPDDSLYETSSAIESKPPAAPFELLEARQIFESHIARLAAENATDSDLAAIEQAWTNHRGAHFAEPKEALDIQFHMAIAQATQNKELALLVNQLWHRRDDSPMWRNLHERVKEANYRDNWVTDHETILKALRKRDGDAAYVAMWQHIENVKTFLAESGAFADT
ncbi:FCD domain-containing protein [Asticcacaulis sp. 201]|uniref:FCD domain-containing protein n=1 Tax=Asticcacaulis sp. 201 TaxID=3028787 RepID=UPI002916BAB2|nr:FCD domain-containing protein [Asticcacaulis sp. 201]MDV6330907.1 FCD domain-containing protein [Asticcacaulis sp. 201]